LLETLRSRVKTTFLQQHVVQRAMIRTEVSSSACSGNNMEQA
jgi:hypothetical protein